MCINVYKYFSGAGKVFLNTSQASSAPERYQISNTSPAPEKYLNALLRAGKAWEVFENTFPAPEKCLYTLLRRRRSTYMHLFGAGEVGEAGEAGEAGEVFIYTPGY